MLNIGCHLSCSDGYAAMARTAVSIGANTFAFFTRNPRGGAAKAINESDIAEYIKIAKEYSFAHVVAHSPYTLNPCAATEHLRRYSRDTMADDLTRMAYIPGNYYNFHPGSHVGQGTEAGVHFIAEALNSILLPRSDTTVLLETMSGKGSEMGTSFEQLHEIISLVSSPDLGVCLDTCHIWDAGYDIVNSLDDVLTRFDVAVGLSKLKAIHLNDSMNPLAAHKDRHAKIGEGHIGLEALVRVINHPALRGLPFILETPNDLDGYAREIALLRDAYRG